MSDNTSSLKTMVKVALPLVLVLALGGCFGRNKEVAIKELPEVPADQLYDEGLAYLNTGNLKRATEVFSALDAQHPYSAQAQRAMVLSAFANFRRGNYEDTVSTADRFVNLYPGNKEVPYLLYLAGESQFRRMSDVTLDQRETRRGIRYFNELVRLYPESEYAEESKRKTVIFQDQLAGKEMQIGRYYQERNEHIAAVNRFRFVVERYQETRHVEEGLFRLVESYLALGVVNEAQGIAYILGYNYPDSEWYKDAYALLGKSDLEPRRGGVAFLKGLGRGGDKS